MPSTKKKTWKSNATKEERKRIKGILSAIPDSETLFPKKLEEANNILSRVKFMDRS